MVDSERRDPDELLAAIQHEEARARRGRLKIFFGASAGVGKTYAMLEAARAARSAGIELVVGYVEPHGRSETEKLLDGLERLPFLAVRYRGITRPELDLDSALQRAPTTLLVDELAHSNITEGDPRPRHAKRWQDIEELLDAGINVWTTLNVQHLESLNDIVAGITGIRQRETIPDRIFDDADEVELIDLPPDDLLERLRSGRVYLPDRAAMATERFFRKPNLLALREIALRRTADRVDAAARDYAATHGTARPGLARDRFLIAVAPDDQAEQLVRFGKRFADAMDAEWLVVSVETPALLSLGEKARNRRIDVLRLAESLGAQTVTLDGPTVAGTLVDYARLRGISRIVVGEPTRRGWRALVRHSTATELARGGHGFDLSIIARHTPPHGRERRTSAAPHEIHWGRYWTALLVSALCTLVAALMYPYFELTNLVMVYLLGATIAALRLGRGPASVTAIVNVAAFDFCFVPPRYTFAVSDFQYVVTFAVMLIVALIIATLVASVRAQSRVAGARERRTSLLYAMSRELVATRTLENLARVAIKHVAETFASEAVVLVPESATGPLLHPHGLPVAGSLHGADLSVAQWVYTHGRPAGMGTDTLPAASAQYLPLNGTNRTFGVLAVRPSQRRRLLLPEQQHLLETFAGQIALAIERAHLAEDAEVARVAAETESLRNTLLSSISHDLRTPLAVIAGASSALNDPTLVMDAATRAKLAASIEGKAREMSELISNVLDLMRFEAGEVKLRREWQTVDDLLGTALEKMTERLSGYTVAVKLPTELPAVSVDGPLITQVFTNLLDNATKYTRAGTIIQIGATAEGHAVRVTVDDNGPGLPSGDSERLFAKFQRGRDETSAGGAGLGLAICRAIVNAHGGRIAATQLPGGGARFEFTLPAAENGS
jgi:two-component system, OmpR family, sensor histidine kinase KdpD